MYYFIGGILACVLLFVITRPYRTRRRDRLFEKEFNKLEELFADGRYEQVVESIRKVPVLEARYKLAQEKRRQVLELEIQSLERLNRIPDAVVILARHLSAFYAPGKWPDDLLSMWISLYKTSDPIEVEKFYFCPICGLHPEIFALFDLAIEHGCTEPIGFPGKSGPKILVEFGGNKEGS